MTFRSSISCGVRWLGLGCGAAKLSATFRRCTSHAQRLAERRQRGRLLAAAGIVQKVSGEGRTPVFEHTYQRATGDLRRNVFLKRESQSQAVGRRANHQVRVVENQWAVDVDDERLTALFELAAIRPRRAATQIDASWDVDSCGEFGFGCAAKYSGEPTTASR